MKRVNILVSIIAIAIITGAAFTGCRSSKKSPYGNEISKDDCQLMAEKLEFFRAHATD